MPKEAEKGTIEYAVSQLRKEPAPEGETPKESATLEVEPEATPEVTQEEVQETVLETETEETDTETEETEGETLESESQTSEEVEEEEEGEPLTEQEPATEVDYYSVKIDGEEYEVTLDELQSGYQRQKDYTRKTQSLAEERKANEVRKGELEGMYQTFLTQSQQADELLNRDIKKFEATDWTRLKEDDPVAYVQKQIEVQELKQAKQQILDQAQAVYEHNQKIRAAEQVQHVELQRKEALKLFPEWSSEEKATANQSQIIAYARSIGYQDTELANIVNAKDLLILDKARKYDALQTTKKGITKKKRPVMRKMVRSKGIAPPGSKMIKERQASRGRLRKSGSIQDAARVLFEARQAKANAG